MGFLARCGILGTSLTEEIITGLIDIVSTIE
jgi:hypothetical protein